MLAAFALALALGCLMVLDLAHVFTVKRELQKVADLAVLAGAAVTSDCGAMQDRARTSAAANGHPAPSADFSAECGTWTPEDGFAASAAATDALRAVAGRDVPYFFTLGGRRVEAQAIARSRASAAFALGTGLAEVRPDMLNRLLGAALRTQVNLTAAGWQGLAAARLSLLDLVDARVLQVGTVRELLATELRMADFVLAMARALEAESPLEARVLRELAAGIPHGLGLQLGELVQTDLADGSAAAGVRLDALQLLHGAAQLANRGQLLDLGNSLAVPGLAQVGVKLALIEPPRLGLGPEGTTARSAQVRLDLLADVGLDLGLVQLSVLKLPLQIRAAPGTATLQRIECAPLEEDCAVEFAVTSGLLEACLGTASAGPGAQSCGRARVADLTVKVALLEIGVGVEVRAGTARPGRTYEPPPRFGHGGFPGSRVANGPAWHGDAGGAAVGALTGDLLSGLEVRLVPDLPLVSWLLTPLLRGVGGALETLLAELVGPLLEALGVGLGTVDLQQMTLDCRSVELVH